MLQCAPQGGRNRPCARTDLQDAPVGVVSHHHPPGVARQAPGRFRGNARAVLEDGLAGLIRIGQYRAIDVHHDLVALVRSAGVELLVQ